MRDDQVGAVIAADAYEQRIEELPSMRLREAAPQTALFTLRTAREQIQTAGVIPLRESAAARAATSPAENLTRAIRTGDYPPQNAPIDEIISWVNLEIGPTSPAVRDRRLREAESKREAASQRGKVDVDVLLTTLGVPVRRQS